MFDYNITSSIDLTEDRTAKYQFQVRHAITSLVLACDDSLFIEKVLTCTRGVYESNLDFTEVSMTPGETFLRVVGELREDMKLCNRTAIELHRQHCHKSVLPDKSIELDDVEHIQLKRATDACRALGCDMDRYPVIVCETLGDGIMGLAENYAIFISRKTFEMGTKALAGTIYEEYCHLKHHFDDCTREFQNHLIDRLMSQYEKTVGEPL